MMRPTIIATFLLAFFSLAASAADLGRHWKNRKMHRWCDV